MIKNVYKMQFKLNKSNKFLIKNKFYFKIKKGCPKDSPFIK